MAISVNRVVLVGRLGRDPERRGGSGGNGPVTFSIATSESWKDKRTGEKRENTQWHNVAVWNEYKQKFLLDYARKGDLLYVEGQLETREWEKDGEKRYSTEVVVKAFGGDVQIQSKERREPGEDRDAEREDRESRSRSSGGGYGGGSSVYDDEIPFAPEWR